MSEILMAIGGIFGLMFGVAMVNEELRVRREDRRQRKALQNLNRAQ